MKNDYKFFNTALRLPARLLKPVNRRQGMETAKVRTIGIVLVLFVLWLLMSGLYYKSLITGLGLTSAILAAFVVRKMDAVDGDRLEMNLNPISFIFYNVWLFGEIAKSNWAVTKLIVSGQDLNQHLFYTAHSQKSDLGQVIFANSITLTPGTITVECEDNRFLVHALSFDESDHDALADMDTRVSATETAGAN